MSTSAEAFWDRYAPKYVAKPIADPSSYHAKLDHVLSLLQPADTVLEIGCGSGCTALQLAPSCAHITASDISSRMIDFASEQQQKNDVRNVRFVHANASRALADAQFDIILAFSLLHLVSDISTVLNTAYRQLKPGGLFISKTVCLRERNLCIRSLVLSMKALRLAPDVNLVSRSMLREHVHQSGFDIIETKYFGDQCVDPFIVARRHG